MADLAQVSVAGVPAAPAVALRSGEGVHEAPAMALRVCKGAAYARVVCHHTCSL